MQQPVGSAPFFLYNPHHSDGRHGVLKELLQPRAASLVPSSSSGVATPFFPLVNKMGLGWEEEVGRVWRKERWARQDVEGMKKIREQEAGGPSALLNLFPSLSRVFSGPCCLSA